MKISVLRIPAAVAAAAVALTMSTALPAHAGAARSLPTGDAMHLVDCGYDFSPFTVLDVDAPTGAVTPVGSGSSIDNATCAGTSMGTGTGTGAVDPTTGSVYWVGSSTGDFLAKVDLDSGVSTKIGQLRAGSTAIDVQALAISSTGKAFALAAQVGDPSAQALFTVDLATAELRMFAPLVERLANITFNPLDRQLYGLRGDTEMVVFDFQSQTQIPRFNLRDTVGEPVEVHAVSFDSSGMLWFTTDFVYDTGYGQNLWSVDPAILNASLKFSGPLSYVVDTTTLHGYTKALIITSATATTPLASAPSVTAQPGSTTVAVGESAELEVAIAGSPTPSVQWQSSADGHSWTDISGATDTKLTVVGAADLNGHHYRARLVNASGEVLSHEAVLTVQSGPSVSGYPEAVSPTVSLAFSLVPQVGGTAPIVFTLISGSLPDGLALDRATGAISGTALRTQSTSATIKASGPGGSVESTIRFDVEAPAPRAELVLDFAAGDVIADGLDVRATAKDLQPGTPWALTLYSDPVVLASGTVDPTGTMSFSGALPAGTPAGSHRIVLTGTGADDKSVATQAWFALSRAGTVIGVSTEGPVSVPAATATTSVSLASTGFDGGGLSLIAFAVAASGALLLSIARVRARRARG